MDLGKTLEGGTKMKSFWGTPLLAQKMTQKSLCKCFASVQFTWMHKLSASKVYVRANSPCLSPLCPKVYLSERKWFVFCSCKSRFLQINVDPGFRFSVSGVTFVSRSVISCSSRQTWSFTPNKMLSSHPCNYLIGYSWEKYTPVAGDIPR